MTERVERVVLWFRSPAALALAVYVAVSFVYFGRGVAAHPGRTVVGSINDPKLFIWMFAWWPHALVHGESPVVTHAIWAPSGYNLAWATSVPALALILSPITVLAGPVVAFDLAAVLLPALAAWTAFLLCRYLTGSVWAGLFGGYLFGFSSYILGHEEGHLNLVAVCLLPLMVLVIVRAFRLELPRRGLALRLGVLLGVEILLSTEVFVTLTIALILALVLALLVVPATRAAIGPVAGSIVCAYVVGSVIASPFLYYALSDFVSGQFTTPEVFVSDGANLVVPTGTNAFAGASSARVAAHFPGNELEQTAYLGVPLVTLLVLFFLTRWRTAAARFLFLAFTAAMLLAFGRELIVDGKSVVSLPWSWVDGLPLLDNVYPGRFTLFASLAVAVAGAVWCASPGRQRWLAIALPVLIVASLVPSIGGNRWKENLHVPAFIAEHIYARCFTKDESVLVLPYGYAGGSTLWQAQSGFAFRMPGGEVGDEAPPSFRIGIVDTLRFDGVPPGGGADVVAFARDKGVGAILVDPTDAVDWSQVLDSAGLHGTQAGGMVVYDLSGQQPPGCGTSA